MVTVLLAMTILGVALALALWTALRAHEPYADIGTFFLMLAAAMLWVLYIDIYSSLASSSPIFSIGQARALVYRSMIDGAMAFLLWRLSSQHRRR